MDLKVSTTENKDNSVEMLDSIRLFPPSANAPDYAIGDLVVSLDKLEKEISKMKEFADPKGQCRFQIRRSKGGNLYSVYNDFYKNKKEIDSKGHSPDRDDDDLPY